MSHCIIKPTNNVFSVFHKVNTYFEEQYIIISNRFSISNEHLISLLNSKR